MHDLSCEGADPSARAGRHQRRDVDLHHHPMIVMMMIMMIMMIDIIIIITMVNLIIVMIFDEDDEESGFDKDDGNQTLYLVFQSVKSIASSSHQSSENKSFYKPLEGQEGWR